MPTSTAAPQWWKYPGSDIPDAPPTPPEGKLSYNDWWNQIESKVDYGTTLGHTPAGGYMNYLAGITVNPVTSPTTSQPTVTQPTTPSTPSEPSAVSGPVTPPTWLGNVPSFTAMKFSDPELSLRPLQAGGSQQLFPSFQMPSFNYPAANPRQGSKNWWEMDWG